MHLKHVGNGKMQKGMFIYETYNMRKNYNEKLLWIMGFRKIIPDVLFSITENLAEANSLTPMM